MITEPSQPVARSLRRALAALAFLGLFVPACTPPEPPPPPDVYRFRGEVTQLAEASRGSELMIRHEALPEFKNAEGEVVGMESMTMPFSVKDDDLLDKLYVGDKVVVTLEVRWEGRSPLLITELEKLPRETVLDFEEPADEPEAG